MESLTPIDPNSNSEDPIDKISDTIGQMMEFWGFKHIMGRIWAILFLSPQPLSAPELSNRLGASSGGISMALRDLLAWGAIRKVCPRDSRKDHYVAEDDIWKLVSRVLSEREKRRIEGALENLQEAISTLQEKNRSDSKPAEVAQFQLKRLEELRKLGKLGTHLLKLLLLRAKVDVSPLQDFFQHRSEPSTNLETERTLS